MCENHLSDKILDLGHKMFACGLDPVGLGSSLAKEKKAESHSE
jgi:hypothetical protein